MSASERMSECERVEARVNGNCRREFETQTNQSRAEHKSEDEGARPAGVAVNTYSVAKAERSGAELRKK